MGQLKSIIYNCKRATFLIEKKLVGRITNRETIELHIHLYGCSVCKLFNRQSRIINSMVQQLFKSSNANTAKLDEAFKEDLQHRIEQELNKN